MPSDAHLVICGPGHPDRNAFETFVRQGFQRKHGASVHSFMPLLLGLRDAAGELVGVAGYRPANAQRLYLEQYLPDPIEYMIAARNPSLGVRRREVAEVGNFACRGFPTAMDLIGLLTDFLLARQHRWVVFTATSTVRGIMRHLGVTLTELAPANRSRVAMTTDDWGSYYSTDPRVMLGYVPAHRGLSGNLS
ncbi:MAG TPA: thermostable hemolysin [Steroidobacteraceae bacterium]|nr:thermostable hemolysin [Steroidobacteraceae bacterium]